MSRRQEELEEKRLFERERMIKIMERLDASFFGEITTATGTKVRTKRAPKYETVEELQEVIEAYFESVRNAAINGTIIVPDVEDFCSFAMISRNTFINWKTPGYKTNAFCEEVQKLDTALAACKKQLMFNGDIPAIPTLADLNNNHGYTNQTQVIHHGGSKELPSIEEVMKKLPPPSQTE